MSISGRLKVLLAKGSWSTRRFQEEVKGKAGKGTRGVSYASVYEYVEGTTEPPLSFLRVAAQVLGVREAWLATGDGHPTDAHAAEAHVAGLVEGKVAEHVLSGIRTGFAGDSPEKGNWLVEDSFARAALVHAWRRKWEGLRRHSESSVDHRTDSSLGKGTALDPIGAELARGIGASLRAALEALNVDEEEMSSDAREDFVMGMVQAIKATAGVPPEPDTRGEDSGNQASPQASATETREEADDEEA